MHTSVGERERSKEEGKTGSVKKFVKVPVTPTTLKFLRAPLLCLSFCVHGYLFIRNTRTQVGAGVPLQETLWGSWTPTAVVTLTPSPSVKPECLRAVEKIQLQLLSPSWFCCVCLVSVSAPVCMRLSL